MSLKHRLARLEAAIAARRRPAEQLVDTQDRWREFQALHADPVRLGLLRSLRSLMRARKLPAERLGEDPQGAMLIQRLKEHMAAKGAEAAAKGAAA